MTKRQQKIKKFRKGAASFYIVAFSTLILVVIATSFAMVMMSELSRSSNDDLSQSAYDSALAGVEDAKIAYSTYKTCVESGASAASSRPTGGGAVTCPEIIWWMEHPDCYMVGHILGRIAKGTNAEVDLGGTSVTGTSATGSTDSTTNQAYTCVQIDTTLNDYKATLSSANKRQTMRAEVGTGATNNVKKIRLSWYSVRSDIALHYTNFVSNQVAFQTINNTVSGLTGAVVATPPTVELQIVQTAPSFTMAQFDQVGSNQTNRATLFLVPTSSRVAGNANNYIGTYNSSRGTNVISAAQVTKTNDHTVSNKAFATYCNQNSTSDFYCSVDIELPGVIGGSGTTRNNKTFMLSVSLPYQQPDTDFSIELICDNNDSACGSGTANSAGSGSKIAELRNTQVLIDSTGRANDLYRRVETRLETSDTTFGSSFPYYALQILGTGTTTKNLRVMSEYNFYF